MKKIVILIFFFLFILFNDIYAQSDNRGTIHFKITPFYIDQPFNFKNGFYVPSMNQATEVTKSFYEASFYGIDRITDKYIPAKRPFYNYIVKNLGYLTFGVLTTGIPFGYGWEHEEFHKSVLRNRGVASYNDVYNFPIFANTIAVSHVADNDLVEMKKLYPADFIRLHLAGYEGENQLITETQKDVFFGNTNSNMQVIYLLCAFGNISYLNMCSTTEANTVTDEENLKDGTNVGRRDFTGLDFTAWAYDLFKPDEAYEIRGIHPSGVGLDRYIKYSDLTKSEQKYLENQGWLSWLSLIDPMIWGVQKFDYNRLSADYTAYWNANIKHNLTSFGSSLNLNVFLRFKNYNLYVSLLNQMNYAKYYPGIDIQLINYRPFINLPKLMVSPRLMVWNQPKNQNFFTKQNEPGGLISLKTNYYLAKHIDFKLELIAKTCGWVAGNVNIDKNFSLQYGFDFIF